MESGDFKDDDRIRDFKMFMADEGFRPSRQLSDAVRSQVHRDLTPRMDKVIAKLLGVHLATAAVSLQVCSQFGVGRTTGVTHFFMGFGEFACMVFCGSLFLGLTALMASALLTLPELIALRKMSYLPVLFLGFISLSAFALFGEGMLASLAMMWLLGGMIMSVFTTEVGIRIRRLA